MKRYALSDIKAKKQIERLNLKNTEQASVSTKSKKNTSSLQATDLRALSRTKSKGKNAKSQRPVFVSNSRSSLDSIYSDHPKENFHLIPAEKLTSKISNTLWSVSQLALAGFLILVLVNLVNVFQSAKQLKSVIVSRASSGVENLINGAKTSTKDLQAGEQQFAQAQADFNFSLEKISFLSAKTPQSTQSNLSSVENILNAGKSISEAGQLFSKSAKNLQNWPTLFIQNNQNFFNNSQKNSQESTTSKTASLTDQLKSDLQNVDLAIEKLIIASQLLQKTDPTTLPTEFREELIKVQAKLSDLVAFLNQVKQHMPAILELLGDRYPHRYLILLQNDTETRPTGGFIGSLMILDLNDGLITKADFHDVYKFDGQLHENIPAPEDIASITENWRLRDSNYSPDFAISAEKAAWFLQKSKGPSVDTVIAVNQSIIADFLDALGPLKVDGLQQPLDSSNFQFMLSFLIESKHFGTSNPKVILEKTISAFRKQLVKIKNPQEIAQIVIKGALDQKIMLYSRDEQVQALFEDLHLTPHPAQIQENSDYLQVVATSIGGNKSDLYITQNITHQTYLNSDGEIIDEVTIARRHNWTQAELEKWNTIVQEFGFKEVPSYMQDLLGRGNNKASIKAYVPLGSELIGTAGIDQSAVQTRSDTELSKTYFRYDQIVEAGLENSITLRYKLPYKLNLLSADIYRFTAEKQLGLINTILKKDLILAPGLQELKANLDSEHRQAKLKMPFQFAAVIGN
ncbi:DUF4012 domain-containing protein [Candidatus Peregrinibacteria bacterium]|nr:DUF4012 domain-containing protein [Candidatus Peregrinibacteria bacterium]